MTMSLDIANTVITRVSRAALLQMTHTQLRQECIDAFPGSRYAAAWASNQINAVAGWEANIERAVDLLASAIVHVNLLERP